MSGASAGQRLDLGGGTGRVAWPWAFDPRLDACVPFDDVPAQPDRGTVVLPSGHRVTMRVLRRTTDPLVQVLTEVWEFTEPDDDGNAIRREEETLRMRWTYRLEMRYLLELS